MKQTANFSIETEVNESFKLSPVISHTNDLVIAGVDEAGRGPLCGPVVAAAVVFRGKDYPIITDSKQMTAKQRATAYDWIMKNCIVGVGQCSPAEIDELNILHASMLAMKRAIAVLGTELDFVLVDGNRLPDNITNAPPRTGDISSLASFDYVSKMNGNDIIGRAIVKGDSRSMSIAAASVVAKETRDKIMCDLAAKYPEYGWDKNMGYPTQGHLQAIKEHGINKWYRKSYKPVKMVIEK